MLPGSFDYLDAIWFLMVTCSTVGYGDVSPKTVLGKVAVMFFLCSKFSDSLINYLNTNYRILGRSPHPFYSSIIIKNWHTSSYFQNFTFFVPKKSIKMFFKRTRILLSKTKSIVEYKELKQILLKYFVKVHRA